MQKKKGISLIVLVITIIVMIILASAIIISLSNTGIIGKAEEAVEGSNLKEVQQIAALAWTEAYLKQLDGDTVDIEQEVRNAITNAVGAAAANDYLLTFTSTGVSVKLATTLGKLVASAEDYGKTVNYSVTVNDVVVDDWKVFYKQKVGNEEYVYLITSAVLDNAAIPTVMTTASTETVTVNGVSLPGAGADVKNQSSEYGLGWESETKPTAQSTISNASIWMATWDNYDTYTNGRCVSYFLDQRYWSEFASTQYGTNMVGAIGTPTAEMFVASWNAKRNATKDYTKYNVELELNEHSTGNSTGYYVNDSDYVATSISKSDSLYVVSKDYWLSTPSAFMQESILTVDALSWEPENGSIGDDDTDFYYRNYALRPVVCLKASTPATVGTTTNISLVTAE